MIVTSWQKRIMITRNQLTVVMWAPCPWSQLTGKECNVVTRRIPFCQSNCTLVSPGYRNDKSYLFLPNYRHKRHSFVRVDLRAAMFSFPSCIALDSSGRLFHDLSRYHAGHQHVPFKHSVLNTSCHVIDKGVDINPVSYRTENKI